MLTTHPLPSATVKKLPDILMLNLKYFIILLKAVEDLEADVDAAATTATKTVILPENAPR